MIDFDLPSSLPPSSQQKIKVALRKKELGNAEFKRKEYKKDLAAKILERDALRQRWAEMQQAN